MALGKAVDKLKNEGTKEDKKTVAGGIAIGVVAVLLIGWGIFFFRSIANGSQSTQITNGAQDQFNFTNVEQAQKAIQQQLSNPTSVDLQAVQQQSSAPTTMQSVPMQTAGQQQTDQFGTPTQGN